MKILVIQRLIQYIATYHFLSSFVVFLVVDVNGVSGRTDLRTKQLLHNIRSHLAQKVDEIVQQKECESGLTLCKNVKKEAEGEEEKSEEIPPPPKIRGHHKPLIKVTRKDVIQTMMPKTHKSFLRKAQKESDGEKPKLWKHLEPESQEPDEESEEDKSEVKTKSKPTSKPVKKFDEKLEPKNKVKKHIEEKEEEEPKKKVKKYEEYKGKAKKTEKARGKEIEKKKKKKEKDDFLFAGGSYIFSMDYDVVKDDLCRKHSHLYLRQLKKYKIWALMMFDASAKLPSGVLQGNTNQFGDFDECLSINAVFKKSKTKSKEPSGIRGKYCLVNVDISTDLEGGGLPQVLERAKSYSFIRSTVSDPAHFIPRFSSINWGLCVPSTCPAEDVENLIESRLAAFNESFGLIFNIQVEEDNCVVKNNLKLKIESLMLVTALFYVTVVFVTLYATYVDSEEKDKEISDTERIEKELEEASRSPNEEELKEKAVNSKSDPVKEKLQKIIMAFSLKRNLKKLFSEKETTDCIKCINGIKAVFTMMLYFAHKTIPLGFTPFTNRVFLTKLSNEASTVLLRTSIIYTDSFLLISGVLTSYNLSREINQKGKISWMRKSFGRFIRLTPALLAVLLFYAYIWDQLGSGPLWNPLVKKNAELCRQYMWRNLLYIQNLFAFENMCAPQTHQLALDMQLSLLAPLFVYFLYKYDKVGVGILQALFLLSSIMRYITTSNNNLSVVIYHGMPVSQLYKTANLMYGQTLYRATPYLLGVIVGYYLKKFEKQIIVPKAFTALGWIIALALGFYSIVSPSHMSMRDYEYNLQEAAQYAALSPVAWSLALAWLIAACHLGHGGKLNELLSNKGLLVFSRISYCVFLTQFLVFFYKVGIKRIPEMFTFSGSFNVTEFFMVTIVSVVATLLFDIPMMEVKKIILDTNFSRSAPLLEELSEEAPETEKDNALQLESQESQEMLEGGDCPQEEIDYPPEEEIDYPEQELEEGYEEDIGEEDEEDVEEEDIVGDEVEGEIIEGDEIKGEEIEENIADREEPEEDEYEMKPLRRFPTNRFLFKDDEDTDWLKVDEEPDTEENKDKAE